MVTMKILCVPLLLPMMVPAVWPWTHGLANKLAGPKLKLKRKPSKYMCGIRFIRTSVMPSTVSVMPICETQKQLHYNGSE